MIDSAYPESSDAAIQRRVVEELAWAPGVDAASIGVAVEDRCVLLAGEVSGFPERHRAVAAAGRVHGVRAITDALHVPRSPGDDENSDAALTAAVQNALRTDTSVPEAVFASVSGGRVTLYGEVAADVDRVAASGAVEGIRHVRFVDNRITLLPRPSAPDTRERIEAALVRNARLDASTIRVIAHGTSVTLTGSVGTLAEKAEATRAAWGSPHVTAVDNQLDVIPRA